MRIEYKRIYGIRSGEFIKIGVSGNPRRRLVQLRLFNPHPTEIVFQANSPHPIRMERRLHELLADHAVGREWFRIDVAQLKVAAKVAHEDVMRWHWGQIAWERTSAAAKAARVESDGENDTCADLSL